METTPNRIVAFCCLACAMAMVGCYIALSKPLALALPVFLLAWLRFLIGAVAMLRWLKKPPQEPPMPRRIKRLLFLESFIGNFLFTLCMIVGITLTSAASAAVIMSSIPAVVALMSWVLLKERIGLRLWIAVACGAFGIGLLALAGAPGQAQAPLSGLAGPQSSASAWLGNALVFCAVLCESFYSVNAKKLAAALSPKRISALINLWSLALMTPFGVRAALHFDFGSVDAGIWLLLVLYALTASVFSVWLWMTGQKSLPAAQAGIFCVLLPISAVLTGVLALGETLGAWQIAAFGSALAGIVLATLPERRPASAQESASADAPLPARTPARSSRYENPV
ncbi:MAG TPA: DMT family transporter [Herbaspirillum sp.]|jgi:drug/metabolite transporter (DMT)-like permease